MSTSIILSFRKIESSGLHLAKIPTAVVRSTRYIKYGWFADGQIQWIDDAFPEDVEHLLLNDENYEDENDEFYGSEIDSHDDIDQL